MCETGHPQNLPLMSVFHLLSTPSFQNCTQSKANRSTTEVLNVRDRLQILFVRIYMSGPVPTKTKSSPGTVRFCNEIWGWRGGGGGKCEGEGCPMWKGGSSAVPGEGVLPWEGQALR